MPGEIDLPIAQDLPDGQFSVSSSIFGGTIRFNLSFQISKNLTGAFRYARVPSASGDHKGYFWDRSFDLHYLLHKEKNIFLQSLWVCEILLELVCTLENMLLPQSHLERK